MPRTLVVASLLAGLVAASMGKASADGPVAPPRRASIPGGVETVTRLVQVPPCLEERRMPVYEVTQEPIYGCRTVPQYGAVLVPVQDMRTEPIYEIRRTPVCGMVDVPVFAQACRPVKGLDFTSWSEERQTTYFSVREEVPCGVRKEHRVLGYREEKVQVGTAQKPCEPRHRVERRFLGYGGEQVILGTREVRRIVGYRMETVVVRPARTETVVERFQRPTRWVTVCDAMPRPNALPGTDAVLTEAEYRAAVAAVSAR